VFADISSDGLMGVDVSDGSDVEDTEDDESLPITATVSAFMDCKDL
jgi:hypothetical protein